MSAVIKFSYNTPDVRICLDKGRPISTIEKLANGNYRVVKLYEGLVEDYDSYNQARDEALNASTGNVRRVANA
ncbi:hypothetical protein D3C78_969740 [compost metagenome]